MTAPEGSSTTAPTMGFGDVLPAASSANSKHRLMNLISVLSDIGLPLPSDDEPDDSSFLLMINPDTLFVASPLGINARITSIVMLAGSRLIRLKSEVGRTLPYAGENIERSR